MFTILIKKIIDDNKYEKLRGKSSKTVMYNRKTEHCMVKYHFINGDVLPLLKSAVRLQITCLNSFQLQILATFPN